MEIQVLRKKSKENSKEITNLKYENADLQSCLVTAMEEIASLKKENKQLKSDNKPKGHDEPEIKVNIFY